MTGPGRESVWDYPRPPRLEAFNGHIQVVFNGVTIADSHRLIRILETSHPPVYYIPPEDIRMTFLKKSTVTSLCEWKGLALYFNIRVAGKSASNAAWSYPDPNSGYQEMKEHIAFYAGEMDACYVNRERVRPQPGDFYGGWITKNIIGPFKGNPGTGGW